MKKQRRSIITEEEEENPFLPEELIVLILLRLPVRSLVRFKCISKWWLSQISDPEFAKSHFDLAASPTHCLFLNFNNRFQTQSLDIESPPNHESAALPNYPLAPLRPDDKIFTHSDTGVQVLGSCRGFLLLRLPNYSLGFLVCNPSTGFQTRIPFTGFRCSLLCGIGYDQSTDDYLLVSMKSSNSYFFPAIEVFSLKTNLPFSPSLNFRYQYVGFGVGRGLFLNDYLHWLVESLVTNLAVVLAFNLIGKSVFEIAPSHDLALKLTNVNKLYRLSEMRGCLALCYSDYGGVTEMWIMREYKVQSSWIKIVLSAHDIPCDSRFFPICFTKCGDVFGSNEFGRLLRLDDKGKLLAVWPEESRFHLLYSCHSLVSLRKQVKMVTNKKRS